MKSDCWIILWVCFTLNKTAKTSFKVPVPCCIPTSNKWEFLLFHILTSIRIVSFLDFISDVPWYLIVLSCISLMIWHWTSFHMFILLCLIFIVRCLFKSLPILNLGSVCSFVESYVFIVYTGYRHLVSYVIHIFSLSVPVFSLTVAFIEQMLILMKSNLSIFFNRVYFFCCIWKPSTNQRSPIFSPLLFLGIL